MQIAHALGKATARSTGLSRRNVVTATAAVAAAAALSSCSVPAPRRAVPTADPAPGMPISSSRRAQLMQILAHPDDDLYFMNPDTQRMLDAGVPLVCVYVTAGESDGVNKAPGRPRPGADKTAYSSARHQGCARRTRHCSDCPGSPTGRKASPRCAATSGPRSTLLPTAPAGSS